MENNKQPQAPQPSPSIVPPSEQKGGSKVVMWFLIGLVVIGLAVWGIYWYLGKQQIATVPIPQPTSKPTAIPTTLDQDLNSIDVSASDSGFTSVDQDIQSL